MLLVALRAYHGISEKLFESVKRGKKEKINRHNVLYQKEKIK